MQELVLNVTWSGQVIVKSLSLEVQCKYLILLMDLILSNITALCHICKMSQCLFSVPPLGIEAGSNEPVAEGGRIQLWCRSQASNPPAAVLWMENGKPISSKHITNSSMKGDFNGIKVRSDMDLSVERSSNGRVVSCTPQFNGFMLKNQAKEFVLNVTCECGMRYFEFMWKLHFSS